MKIYNPFKQHIVRFADGTFAVRKRGWLGGAWVYKDRDGWCSPSSNRIQWWLEDHLKHCKVTTYSHAVEIMDKKPKIDPNKVVQVYYG
jgi:hypothetical protein